MRSVQRDIAFEGDVSSFVVDFIIYSRATPAAAVADDDPELNEQHWTYMDRFGNGMTARGPTLGPDRETWTGSLHVVDLPDPEAAREFVASEPYNQAGLFEEHLTWRFTNALGRSMWQFVRAGNEPLFLILAYAATEGAQHLSLVTLADLPSELRERLVLYGGLRTFDDDEPAGVALAVQAPSREALVGLVGGSRAGLADYDAVEIHDWEFGGRR